ncbi:MAG: hypothetical protein ACF8LK_05625 [Phycisphaerales bacterium JB041]
MSRARASSWSLAVLVLLLCGAAPVSAQDADPLPTLDELLGTEGGASEGGDVVELPGEGGETELDRLLSGQEIVDEFRSAVDLMTRSAERLSGARDTGLATQRMQEDVLRALDKLIADAQQRGQQSSSSSSSSSSQEQQGQRQQQPGQQTSPQASRGDNRGEANAPGRQDGALGPEQAADLAAWGNLPARFRDALVQGASDRFSATYRRLTEEYYRRLAEDPEE